MNDSTHSYCNYRFKGNSCNECPLNCVYKNRNNSRSSGRINDVDIERILKYKQMKRDELIEIIINQEFELINLRNRFDQVVYAYNCATNNVTREEE